MRQRDRRVVVTLTFTNTRRPLKDGYYDHRQNCLEYVALMFGPGTRRKAAPKEEPSCTVTVNSLTWMSM